MMWLLWLFLAFITPAHAQQCNGVFGAGMGCGSVSGGFPGQVPIPFLSTNNTFTGNQIISNTANPHDSSTLTLRAPGDLSGSQLDLIATATDSFQASHQGSHIQYCCSSFNLSKGVQFPSSNYNSATCDADNTNNIMEIEEGIASIHFWMAPPCTNANDTITEFPNGGTPPTPDVFSKVVDLSYIPATFTASFTGSISGTTLTTTGVTGSIHTGQVVVGVGVPNCSGSLLQGCVDTIESQLGGTPNGAGTYRLRFSATVGSEAMTSTNAYFLQSLYGAQYIYGSDNNERLNVWFDNLNTTNVVAQLTNNGTFSVFDSSDVGHGGRIVAANNISSTSGVFQAVTDQTCAFVVASNTICMGNGHVTIGAGAVGFSQPLGIDTSAALDAIHINSTNVSGSWIEMRNSGTYGWALGSTLGILGSGDRSPVLSAGTGFGINFAVNNGGTNMSLDTSGHLFLQSIRTAAGNEILCYNTSGNEVTYENAVAGCVPSAMATKNIVGSIDPRMALDKISLLTAGTYTYKDTKLGTDEHDGLYADEVCAMDERLCVRDKDGNVHNYDKWGVIAYQAAAIKELKAELDDLKQRMK